MRIGQAFQPASFQNGYKLGVAVFEPRNLQISRRNSARGFTSELYASSATPRFQVVTLHEFRYTKIGTALDFQRGSAANDPILRGSDSEGQAGKPGLL